MLHVTAADALEVLADGLAEVLAEPLADPMQPEWIAAPSQGMARWLRIRLARSLGATSGDRHDGVAANLDIGFPGALRHAVLAAGRPDDDPDPWEIDRLVWSVLGAVHENPDDPRLARVTSLPDGATWYGRARRLADLFDRYAVHRPEMVRAWARGDDVDGAGNQITTSASWQPYLWRLVRDRVDTPSPAEQLPVLLERIASGKLVLDLPPRLSFFGLATLPGGEPFLDLVTAMATQHDIHLFLFLPSPGMAARVEEVVANRGSPVALLRSEDPSLELVAHPLIRSWARLNREAVVLVARAAASGAIPERVHLSSPPRAVGSLLARLQADLRAGTVPVADFELRADDRSIEIHAAHGASRQVEVLRDAILHRLAEDPTLREDEILVVCPDIDRFAPVVEAVFGPPAGARHEVDGTTIDRGADDAPAVPRLSYRITDRSLRDSYGMLAALAALVDLVGGRFSASTVLDFLTLAPVRLRFDLDDDALAAIARWAADAEIRWGLDGDHRAAWGIPGGYAVGSWRAVLDRLLTGVAISDDEGRFAVGDILPSGVEGSGIPVLGRLADVVARLEALAREVAESRDAASWCALLRSAADDLFAAPRDALWQLGALTRLLNEIDDAASAVDVPLTLADVRRLLAERLGGAPGRSDFFRGGVTVSSLTPLRGVPFRVVCVLGMDDGAFGPSGADGDDLVAASAHLGDRDARAETRQALLETVLAAGECLIITRTGTNVVTNQRVPRAVPLAELRDAILLTMVDRAPTLDEPMRIERRHPRQSFDEENFDRSAGADPWSFDSDALAGAVARCGPRRGQSDFVDPLLEGSTDTVIDLGDLQRMLRNPVREFLTRRLEIRLPRSAEETSDDLPTSIMGLDEWKVADRLLDAVLAGGDGATWVRREQARGSLPPGVLGTSKATKITGAVEEIAAVARTLGHRPGAGTRRLVDFELADGTRIVGAVRDAHGDRPGPMQVSYSKYKPQRLLKPWLDLMALVAHDPATDWQSILLNRGKSGDGVELVILEPRGDDAVGRNRHALDALAVAVDCYRRGWCEPIPVFTAVSRNLFDGTPTPSEWKNERMRFGDGYDTANEVVYGDLDFHELLEIPARESDPPGAARGRVARFAEHLWGAMRDSTLVLAGLEDDS